MVWIFLSFPLHIHIKIDDHFMKQTFYWFWSVLLNKNFVNSIKNSWEEIVVLTITTIDKMMDQFQVLHEHRSGQAFTALLECKWLEEMTKYHNIQLGHRYKQVFISKTFNLFLCFSYFHFFWTLPPLSRPYLWSSPLILCPSSHSCLSFSLNMSQKNTFIFSVFIN